MAERLPGLRPTGDRPSVGGRNTGRVAVPNNVRLPGLQPARRPVDTYVRPEAPAQGPSEMLQLAQALSSISPQLNSMLNSHAVKAKQEAEDLANRRIGGMSFEEARAAVDSGSMSEMSNPWFKAAFMKQYGERLGYQRMNELSAQYAMSTDKETMNFDEFVAKTMAGDLDQYGDDRFFTAAYGQIMAGYNAKGGAAHAQYLTDQTMEETKGGVFETFLGQAKSMLGEGKSPEEIVTALRGRYDGNREMLHVDYKTQDAEMVRVAQALAEEGQYDLVAAILNGNRTGSDGTVLGSLSSNREFAADAARIIARAETVQHDNTNKATEGQRFSFWNQAQEGNLNEKEFEAFYKANPGAYTEAGYLSLLNSNRSTLVAAQELAAKNGQKLDLIAQSRASEEQLILQDLESVKLGQIPFLGEGKVYTETGEERIVSIDDRKKAVASRLSELARVQVEQKQLTGQEAFDVEAGLFIANNLENPTWSNVLEGGHVGANAWSVTAGNVPPALKQGAELYEQLHAKGPAFLRKHIKDQATLDFYEAYRIAHQDIGMEPDAAYAQAIAVTRDPAKFDNPYFSQKFKEIEDAVNGVAGGFLGIGATENANSTDVAGYISRVAKQYARSGKSPQDSIKLATERFKMNHTNVNGWWVNTADADIPPQFGELATNAMDQYVSEFGKAEGIELSDLTIAPAGNGTGQWMIIHKLDGTPVFNGKRMLTMQDILKLNQERLARLQLDLQNDINKRMTDQQGLYEQQKAILDKLAGNGSLVN